MVRQVIGKRFQRIHNPKEREESDHMYRVHFDWATYFVKGNTEKAVSYLDECLEINPSDSKALHLRSVCKLKLAIIDAALQDALEAAKFENRNPCVNWEICEGVYEQNDFEGCVIALYENIRKYRGAVVHDFKDRLVDVNENFKDSLGDSLSSFLCKNIKNFPGIAELIQQRKKIDKRPLWKIRKDNGECDILSIEEKQEELLSPLELARRKRWYRIFSQIYFEKSWVDEAFLRGLVKDDSWVPPNFTSSRPVLLNLLNPDYNIVKKFMRMLHARSPLYSEYHRKFGNQKFLKRNNKQYLYQQQLQTRKKMFATLRTLKELRKLGRIETMARYIEDVIGDIVTLKTSRIMPWKFEFLNDVYNTVALAHADRYAIPDIYFHKVNAFNSLQALLNINADQSKSYVYEFGNRSTYVAPDAVDPKHEKQKKLIARLKKRLIFSKHSIEKCYLLYEMARSFLKINRYGECNSMAKQAIEESANCSSLLWAFLSTMLVVKSYVCLHKLECCHDALIDALNIADHLKCPQLLGFVQLAYSINEDNIARNKSFVSLQLRKRHSRHTSVQSLQNSDYWTSN